MWKNVKLTPLLETIKFRDITDEEYFGAEYSKYISNSKLALVNEEQGGSPLIFRDGLSKHSKYSDSLVFGSAVHELALQPDLFELVPQVIRPTAKLGFMADELYKVLLQKQPSEESTDVLINDEDVIKASDKIDYYKGKMNRDKIDNVIAKSMEYWTQRRLHENTLPVKSPIYLDAKSQDKLESCINSFRRSDQIRLLLNPQCLFTKPVSLNEAALFMDVKAELNGKEVILPLKAKLDNFTVDFDVNKIVLNDLKTTGHYLTDFGESFKKFHYNRQMAMYLWLLKLYVEHEYNMEVSEMNANMLLVSTVPNYFSGVFTVSNGEIAKGFAEFKKLLSRVAYYEIYGYDVDGCVGTEL